MGCFFKGGGGLFFKKKCSNHRFFEALDFALRVLVVLELLLDGFGHVGEEAATVLHPELVLGIQIARFGFGLVGGPVPVAVGSSVAAFALLHRNAVQIQIQNVVHQRLVRPRVVQRRRHVHVAVYQHEQRSLEPKYCIHFE